MAKTKILAGFVSSRAYEKESVPYLIPSFWQFAGNLGIPWLVETIP